MSDAGVEKMSPEETGRLLDPARLAAVAATGLLDTSPEEPFDRLTRLAARFLDAPLSQVNLVDDRRQFSKSCVAPPWWPEGRDTPLPDSFCKWAVVSREPVVVEDARADLRLADTGTVTEKGLISYLGIPLRTSAGYVVGALCVAGFEPRRWTEDQVSILADLAASVVTEVELRRDLAARRQVERMKDELVSVVSHELRTPLTSIRGSLGLLASGKLGTLSEQGQRMLEIAAQNSDRLVRLINDMLDLERTESGTAHLEMGWAAAAELVSEAVAVVEEIAAGCGVGLETRVPPELSLRVDADRIVRVLVNLLSNAIKFSPAGAAVQVIVERRGAEALFQVRDRGRGIPADKLESIFERFRQVDSSDAREKGGTGLGLAISRSIVQQHHGRIWVASEAGKGSTFFFSLPVDAPPGRPA